MPANKNSLDMHAFLKFLAQYVTLPDPNTWPHVLLHCQNRYIHGIIVKRYIEAVWEIRKLIISSNILRCFIRMGAGIFHDNPQENTIPSWLLPCTCSTQRCHCNARLKPDIVCVKGLPYEAPPPNHIDPNLTIQFIEFKYKNDRFSQEAIDMKIEKY